MLASSPGALCISDLVTDDAGLLFIFTAAAAAAGAGTAANPSASCKGAKPLRGWGA